jgi:hypothetical protein
MHYGHNTQHTIMAIQLKYYDVATNAKRTYKFYGLHVQIIRYKASHTHQMLASYFATVKYISYSKSCELSVTLMHLFSSVSLIAVGLSGSLQALVPVPLNICSDSTYT